MIAVGCRERWTRFFDKLVDTKSAESDPSPKANPNGVVPPATQIADAMRTLANEKVAGPDYLRGVELLNVGERVNYTILDELPMSGAAVPGHHLRGLLLEQQTIMERVGQLMKIIALVTFAGRVLAPQNCRPPSERICENIAVFVPSDRLYIVRRLSSTSSFRNQRGMTLLIVPSAESCYKIERYVVCPDTITPMSNFH